MSRVIFKDGFKKHAKCLMIFGEHDAIAPTNGHMMKELPDLTHIYMDAIKQKQCDSATAIAKDCEHF